MKHKYNSKKIIWAWLLHVQISDVWKERMLKGGKTQIPNGVSFQGYCDYYTGGPSEDGDNDVLGRGVWGEHLSPGIDWAVRAGLAVDSDPGEGPNWTEMALDKARC